MNIVGICRFSLLGKGDWKAFQGKSEEEAQILLTERAAHLFSRDRMEARLKTFELLTLASLRAQTDQNFRFLVLSSDLMPTEFKDRLKALCENIPQVTLRFFPVISVHEAQRIVFRELNIKYSQTLQFRLDDDDCVCIDFIEAMREFTATRMNAEGVFVASIRGVMYSSVGGKQDGVYHWPVEFMSAGAAIRHPSKSIYEFGHFGMATRFPTVVIENRLSLVTHNGTNDTQFTAATIKHRGMVMMSSEEINRSIEKNFPFLTDESREIAGLNNKNTEKNALNHESQDPQWLNDLLTTKNRRGFLISDDLFALQHTYRSGKVLYVSFDNLASVRASTKYRDPWGYAFAKKMEWSSLGVLCYRPNWYRIPRLHDELHNLAERGFFKKFKQVIFSGTSMGAYAACAFSSISPGCTVIAFSPQATLDPEKIDWDNRYPSGTAADWSGLFADAGSELRSAKHAWIVFDPLLEEDRRHAGLLEGSNVTLLKARYSGHFTAQYMRQVGILSGFVKSCATGDMSVAKFYSQYRTARQYRRYLDGLVHKLTQHPSHTLRERAISALRTANRPALANDLARTLLPPDRV
ncbi:glycosyltransferase [Paracoccus litorisediminis]|nr:glycosyltransferase [Paracoccus litorisediminis]